MNIHLKYGTKSLALGLSFLIAFPPLHAQTLPTDLNIVVVEGEGAINNVRQRVAREPVVRVEDENHKPIAGAAVVFTLPTEGATGEFSNGGKSLTMITDSQGRAGFVRASLTNLCTSSRNMRRHRHLGFEIPAGKQ